MLRDKSLIPLSRQHQHVLALCVRIDRASPIGNADLAAWQAEIAQLLDFVLRRRNLCCFQQHESFRN